MRQSSVVVDHREVGRLLDEIERVPMIQFEQVLRRIALQLFEALRRRTPVDTGRARSGWLIVYGESGATLSEAPPASAYKGRQQVAPPSADKQTRGTLSDGTVLDIWVINNVEYIVRLEYGYSRQAPAGMISPSVAEILITLRSLLQQVGALP